MSSRDEWAELEAFLQAAWAATVKEEPRIAEFLKDGDNDRYERAVAFRIGHHLSLLAAQHERYRSLSVDMELHRRSGGDLKTNEGRAPDLILHQRGSNIRNLLAVEFKASANRAEDEHSKDVATLMALLGSPLNYSYAACAVFDVRRGTPLLIRRVKLS